MNFPELKKKESKTEAYKKTTKNINPRDCH